MKNHQYIFVLLLAMAALTATASGQSPLIEEEKQWLEKMSIRFDLQGWPNKTGPVIGGVEAKGFLYQNKPMVQDFPRWTNLKNETVLTRTLLVPSVSLSMELTITKSCETAHEFLFKHLSQLCAAMDTSDNDLRTLPLGRKRLYELGDVCFGISAGKDAGYHTIEMVRNNVVVVIKSRNLGNNKRLTQALFPFAKSVDTLLKEQVKHRNAGVSKRWPQIYDFSVSPGPMNQNSKIPLNIIHSERKDAKLLWEWEVNKGGIIKEDSGYYFYPEGKGPFKITLLLANERGLVKRAQLIF